jgi:hypothetical protein
LLGRKPVLGGETPKDYREARRPCPSTTLTHPTFTTHHVAALRDQLQLVEEPFPVLGELFLLSQLAWRGGGSLLDSMTFRSSASPHTFAFALSDFILSSELFEGYYILHIKFRDPRTTTAAGASSGGGAVSPPRPMATSHTLEHSNDSHRAKKDASARSSMNCASIGLRATSWWLPARRRLRRPPPRTQQYRARHAQQAVGAAPYILQQQFGCAANKK